MSKIILELSNLLDELKIADIFEKIDMYLKEKQIRISDTTLLSTLRKEFILGLSNVNFYERLKAFIKLDIREIEDDNNIELIQQTIYLDKNYHINESNAFIILAKQKKYEQIEFQNYKKNLVKYAVDGLEKPNLIIEIDIDYPIKYKKENILNIIQSHLSHHFGGNNAKYILTEDIESYISSILHDYNDLVKESLHLFKTEHTFGFDWEYKIYGEPLFNDRGILSYAIYSDIYTGGAHGFQSKNCFTIDLETGKKLIVKDIIYYHNIELLTDKLTNRLIQIKKRNEGRPETFDDQIPPSENFYLKDNEIIFIYHPYEIAPYSEGIIEIPLGFNEVKEYINTSCPVRRIYE
jgi:hypothetical protein